jgi:tetratricopeptide (TPR) repeat protein
VSGIFLTDHRGEESVLLKKLLLCFSIMILLAAAPCLAQEGAIVQDATVPEHTNSVLMSSIEMWRGERALASGNTEEATEHFLRASGDMRNSPDPHFALARVYLHSSLMDSFLEVATGTKLFLTDFVYQSLLVSNLAIILLIALGLTLYSSAAVIVARHALTVWHSVTITLSPLAEGWYLKAILVGAVLSFFIVLSGHSLTGVVTWTLVIGIALCWRFAVSSERKLLAALVVFLIVFGLLLDACSRILSTQQPDSPVRLAAMVDRTDEPRLAGSLDGTKTPSRFDPINEFMLGLLALKRGDNDSAIERFNIASKFALNNPAILNNLGVAYHRLGNYEEAMRRFKEALRYGPREALIHYNYAQTLNALLQYDLSQEELAKASTLDFDLTRALVTQRDAGALVPMNLQNRILWRLALDSEAATVRLSYSPVESGTTGVVVLILLSGAAVVLMRKAKVPARCDVCGRTVPSEIARRKRKEFLCSGCNRIKESGATSQDVEEDLENRLKRRDLREAVTRTILGFVIPGSAHYLSGRRCQGLALAFLVFSLLVLVVSGDAVIKPIPKLGMSSFSGWTWPFLLIVYALYCWRSTVLAIRSIQET